jgi:subtilisin-like proprotein convertase family protein
MKGGGVLVAIVDNGIDIHHEDLEANIAKGSYNYMPPDYNFSDADHGTCCAGIIAGVEGNGIGIRGVAPEAKLIGYNALKVPSISNIADAFVRHKERVWVSSNSWGDFNSWGEPFALKSLEMAALEEGVAHGRDGRGIVYVFAAGNGASHDGGLPTDNVNYSGLVNNRFTIPVGAVDENGTKVPYSEVGATLMVVAPSRAHADSPGIVTTDATADKGYNPNTFKADYKDTNYTRYFSGTSASTPMVSGVVALILEANPKLGWRDVREILARSASKTDPDDPDWSTNGAGLHINHKYGFGLVDACKAIGLAWDWHNLPKQKMVEIHKGINITIPDNDPNGIESSITIDANLTVEFVDIFFDAHDHASLGDLEIVLTSPSGTRSILAETHVEAFDGYFRYKNWRFGSVRHLGEKSKGVWKLKVIDRQLGNEGTLVSWGLKMYGY